MCLLPTPLNPTDGAGAAATLPDATVPSYALVVDDGDVMAWRPRRPRPDLGRVIHDLGYQRLAVVTDPVVSGTGTIRASGPISGRYQVSGTLSTSTNSAGRAARWLAGNGATNIVFDSASGTWTYEATFQIPTLPDGTQSFGVVAGFIDAVVNVNGTVDGAYLFLDQNDAQFQFFTRSNSNTTQTDTGVTAVAGTWYRLKIVVTNDDEASIYIVADAAGAAYGAAKATHSTNIPSGAGRETSAGIYIRKTAGTTARTLLFNAQHFVHGIPGAGGTPAAMVAAGMLNPGDGIGIALGAVGTGFMMDRSEPSRAAFTDQELPTEVIPFDVIETFTISNRTFFSQLGTGGTTATGSGREDHMVATCTLAAAQTGARWYRSIWDTGVAPADVAPFVFDDDSGTIVFECVVFVPTLSSAGSQMCLRMGFNDTNTGAPVDGAFIEIDSNVDAQFQCVTRSNSTETRTDSGVTMNAATWYQIRIVVTNDDSVDFYVRALDTAWGSPAATHTTNIPSGSSRATAPAMQADVVGNSNAGSLTVDYDHHRCYQRLAS